jgi:hypothetical protein
LVTDEPGHKVYKNGNETLTIDTTDNTVRIEYKDETPTLKDQIEEFAKSLDDESFIETCTRFTDKGYSLGELSNNPTEELFALFKSLAKPVLRDKILSLTKVYNTLI